MKDINPFKIFDKDWAIVTAGDLKKHNSMTVSWGGMGTLWSKSVVTVYVKPCRYTYNFMENNDFFVVSFYDEKYRNALKIMGSTSGRNCDKDKTANLTPYAHDDVTLYKEAKLSIICKKIYFNDLNIDNIPQEAKQKYYKTEAPHRMYIGEVAEIIENQQ